MLAPLHITQRAANGVVVLELGGRLVFDEGDELLRDRITGLVQEGSRLFLLDMRKVSYIDSGGVGALVEMYLHVTKRGGRLKLLCPSRCAHRVLDITRLTTVFEIFEDERTALASFGAVTA